MMRVFVCTIPQACTRMNASTKCATIGIAQFVAHLLWLVAVVLSNCRCRASEIENKLPSRILFIRESVWKSFEFNVCHHEINGIGTLKCRSNHNYF